MPERLTDSDRERRVNATHQRDNELVPIILCVDDDAQVLAMRKMVLERAGYKVISATRVEWGLEMCRDVHVDLILTNQVIGASTGKELAFQVRRFNRDVSVGLYCDSPELMGDSDYANAFLSKWVGTTDLLVKVASLLKL